MGCAIWVCNRCNSSEESEHNEGEAKLSEEAEQAITAGHAREDCMTQFGAISVPRS